VKAKVVYDNIKDKELLDKINLKVPFFIEYINVNTKDGKKEGFRVKSHWGARLNPFVELLDDENKIIKVFYSEKNNAINQLTAYLNESKN
jgi:hypothetical protein